MRQQLATKVKRSIDHGYSSVPELLRRNLAQVCALFSAFASLLRPVFQWNHDAVTPNSSLPDLARKCFSVTFNQSSAIQTHDFASPIESVQRRHSCRKVEVLKRRSRSQTFATAVDEWLT